MMCKMVLNVVVLMVVCGVVVEGQRLGIDVSVPVSQSEFASAKAHGKFSFAIPRLWRSIGQADSNGAANVANAQAAGYSVDGYAFICPNGGGASEQVQALASHIQGSGIQVNTVWLDVEGMCACVCVCVCVCGGSVFLTD